MRYANCSICSSLHMKCRPPPPHVCKVVVRRAMVILASSASPAAASTTAALMLRGHLPPQVAMTPAMMIPSPLASARPNAVAVAAAVAAHVLPEAWAHAPLVAEMKAVRTQEAERGEKVRNQKCQADYAHITAGRTTRVMDQDLCQSKAWLANRQPLAGVMAGLSSSARRHRPVIAVVAGASC
jgi:hypothetical protein